jgi:hypothetical protein
MSINKTNKGEQMAVLKYTNAMVAQVELIYTITNSDGERELDQEKFDTWKADQIAMGNTFPTGKRGKVVDTEELTNVKQAIYTSLKKLPHVATSGKKGYIIDDIGQLVEAQLLLRVVEADKGGVSKKRFEDIHKATKLAMDKKTPKKK